MTEGKDLSLKHDDVKKDNSEETKNPIGKDPVKQAVTVGKMNSTSFKDLFLKEELMRAIEDCGLEHQSEVQQKCLPKALMGSDVLGQAKSGTGKTTIIVISVLNRMDVKPNTLSDLIICHTHELAYEIQKEFSRFSKYMSDIKTEVFCEGKPISDHEKILDTSPPHILVGTPGRLLALIRKNILKLNKVKFFILEECDMMLQKLDMREDVQKIFMETPNEKQVMMFSTTLQKNVLPACLMFMNEPFEIIIDSENKLILFELKQYFLNIKEDEKNKKLNDLLNRLVLTQVTIFVGTAARAIELNKFLIERGFPSVAIHKNLEQEELIGKYRAFKESNIRIIVATDIFGRGIDIDPVSIVINYDIPFGTITYLHRVCRAGRFGTKGLAINFISNEADRNALEEVQSSFEVSIPELTESIDLSAYINT